MSDITTQPQWIEKKLSKKDIELLAYDLVQQEVQEGFTDTIKEIVSATKLAAFFTSRVNALRTHALNEMGSGRKRSELGAVVSIANSGGRWEFSDNYLAELEEEIKIVKDKAKLSNPKDRIHVTLSGEEITIKRAIKEESGETLKITL